MSLDERVSEVIKRIYRAGPHTGEWDRVASDVMQLTGASAALTTLVDLNQRELSTYRAFGAEDSKFARGIEEYADTHVDDPSLRWASEHPSERICNSIRTLPACEYLKSDFVRWNLDRFGSTQWCVGYTPPSNDLSFSFSVLFPAAEGPASRASLKLFRMLFDHMECAVELHRRPFNPESTRSVLILDGRGVVLHLTTAAQQLLRRPGALEIVGKRLQTALGSEQAALDAALAHVAAASVTGSSPTALKIKHPLHARPWLLTVRPIMERHGPFGKLRCELLLEIHDAGPRIGNLGLVQSLFALTERELQIVRMLADGHSIASLAGSLGISSNTGRAHLRSIFAKTSTARQSELLLLCASLAQP